MPQIHNIPVLLQNPIYEQIIQNIDELKKAPNFLKSRQEIWQSNIRKKKPTHRLITIPFVSNILFFHKNAIEKKQHSKQNKACPYSRQGSKSIL